MLQQWLNFRIAFQQGIGADFARAYLSNVCVAKELHRNGLGYALVAKSKLVAQEWGMNFDIICSMPLPQLNTIHMCSVSWYYASFCSLLFFGLEIFIVPVYFHSSNRFDEIFSFDR